MKRLLKWIGRDVTGRTIGKYKFRIIEVGEFDIFGDKPGKYFIVEKVTFRNEKFYTVEETRRLCMIRL